MRKIIENYSEPGYWYRKYDDGWIEQGGTIITSIATGARYTLTFPRPFTNVPLCIRTSIYDDTASASSGHALALSTNSSYLPTATTANFYNDGSNARPGFCWEACGY